MCVKQTNKQKKIDISTTTQKNKFFFCRQCAKNTNQKKSSIDRARERLRKGEKQKKSRSVKLIAECFSAPLFSHCFNVSMLYHSVK